MLQRVVLMGELVAFLDQAGVLFQQPPCSLFVLLRRQLQHSFEMGFAGPCFSNDLVVNLLIRFFRERRHVVQKFNTAPRHGTITIESKADR